MAKKARKSTAQVVIASRVKDLVSTEGFRTAGNLPEAVNEKVVAMILAAVERARGNKRGTVRPHDL